MDSPTTFQEPVPVYMGHSLHSACPTATWQTQSSHLSELKDPNPIRQTGGKYSSSSLRWGGQGKSVLQSQGRNVPKTSRVSWSCKLRPSSLQTPSHGQPGGPHHKACQTGARLGSETRKEMTEVSLAFLLASHQFTQLLITSSLPSL